MTSFPGCNKLIINNIMIAFHYGGGMKVRKRVIIVCFTDTDAIVKQQISVQKTIKFRLGVVRVAQPILLKQQIYFSSA